MTEIAEKLYHGTRKIINNSKLKGYPSYDHGGRNVVWTTSSIKRAVNYAISSISHPWPGPGRVLEFPFALFFNSKNFFEQNGISYIHQVSSSGFQKAWDEEYYGFSDVNVEQSIKIDSFQALKNLGYNIYFAENCNNFDNVAKGIHQASMEKDPGYLEQRLSEFLSKRYISKC